MTKPVPPALLAGPFARQQGIAAGATKGMLQGSRFVRVHPGVWRHLAHEMTPDDWIKAARLALPDRARTTGITRIQQLGLDFGPLRPVRYVLQGDHHLAIEGIFLHRTALMPPTDEVGVTPTAAFVAYCAEARVIDAIKVGDWLLHHCHMTIEGLSELVLGHPWRRGAAEATWVMQHLDGDSWSLMESETRALVIFAGLPTPRCNAPVRVSDAVTLLVDLWFDDWGAAVEYEGRHHQTERAQYVADIDRYELMRRASIPYRQVTKEQLALPRNVVRTVHRMLVETGYDGPAPSFGPHWAKLFRRLSDLEECRRTRPAVSLD